MPAYSHFQELKQAEKLPNPKKIGACLTCRFWDVPANRGEAQVNLVSLCLYTDLRPHQLIVSGSSGCNKWEKQPGVPQAASDYAERGEAA